MGKRVMGVSRMADNGQAILVVFRDRPSDDELREFHEFVRDFEPFDLPALQRLRKESA